ncbi:CcmD family protein [candidate division KSB1 bacterium]
MGYLFSAFFIIWIVLFGYLFNLGRKQKDLFREIDKLKEDMNLEKK